jgi:hypothetical protein
MTTQEIIDEVYDSLGQPTELCPWTDPNDPTTFAIGTYGGQKMLRWLNFCYKMLYTGFKLPTGRYIRIKNQVSCIQFQNCVVIGTLTSGSTNSCVFATGVYQDNDRYNMWNLETTGGTGSGQTRLIVDYNGISYTATLNKAWDVDPDNTTTYRLSKNFYPFGVNPYVNPHTGEYINLSQLNGIYSLIQVKDLTTAIGLTPVTRLEDFTSQMGSTASSVSSYKWEGTSLLFDTSLNEQHWFSLKYRGIPASLVQEPDVPLFPENWHPILVFMVLWYGFKNRLESTESMDRYNAMQAMLAQMVQQSDFEMDEQEMMIIPNVG